MSPDLTHQLKKRQIEVINLVDDEDEQDHVGNAQSANQLDYGASIQHRQQKFSYDRKAELSTLGLPSSDDEASDRTDGIEVVNLVDDEDEEDVINPQSANQRSSRASIQHRRPNFAYDRQAETSLLVLPSSDDKFTDRNELPT